MQFPLFASCVCAPWGDAWRGLGTQEVPVRRTQSGPCVLVGNPSAGHIHPLRCASHSVQCWASHTPVSAGARVLIHRRDGRVAGEAWDSAHLACFWPLGAYMT